MNFSLEKKSDHFSMERFQLETFGNMACCMLVSTLFSAKQGIHQAKNEDDGGVLQKIQKIKNEKTKKEENGEEVFPR